MVMKIVAIAALVMVGLVLAGRHVTATTAAERAADWSGWELRQKPSASCPANENQSPFLERSLDLERQSPGPTQSDRLGSRCCASL
jgi:hypothetical protein